MKSMLSSLARRTRRLSGLLSLGLTLSIVSPAILMAQPQAAVALGAAGDFAILAGSLVSNVPASAITGDLGLSPAAGSLITGFGDAEVTGIIYTVDASGPAGSIVSAALLATAKGDLTIAYNDAAGRVPVPTDDFLNPGSGNIAGLTLVSGLYKFTSGLSIAGADVTLTGSETDVWIFQIASDLVVANGVQVILAGGAQAANIFWQVGTSATLGTSCVFHGTILADQSISLGTGAVLNGRALASIAAVTIASSTITVPVLLTSTVEGDLLPDGFGLSQNYPNPFNPSTMINYQLPVSSQVTLTITDMLGRELGVLVNDVQSAGRHQIEWDARNYASGTYFYRLQAGSFVSVKQMVLVK